MTVQTIGAHSVALYLTPADLRPHGAAPDTLSGELAQALTRRACAEAGIPLEGPLELETYPDAWGVLVFARSRPPRRVWFAFPGLEVLLSAARALGPRCPAGDLFWCQGAYYLSLPAEAEQAACRLCEFAPAAGPAALLEARLSEHGRALLAGNAPAALLRLFPEPMEET